MSFDPITFKGVMSRFASGVTIVTVQHNGQRHGLTASSFSSLSLSPPLVLVCVGKHTYSHGLIEQSHAFAVNILSYTQQEWGQRFADSKITDRFVGIEAGTALTGSPILPGSLAWIDCTLQQTHDAGDHTIFVGKVVAGEFVAGEQWAEMSPLLYYNRNWHTLPR